VAHVETGLTHAEYYMSMLAVGMVFLKLGGASRVFCLGLMDDLHASSSSTDKRCSKGQSHTKDRTLLQFGESSIFAVPMLAPQRPRKHNALERMKAAEDSTHGWYKSKLLLNETIVAETPTWPPYEIRGNPFTGRNLGAPFLFYFICLLAIKCCVVVLVIAWRHRVSQLRVACEDFIAQEFDIGLLGMMVSVRDVNVHPVTAHIQFSRVTLSNPPGYESEYLLQAEEISVSIDTVKLVLGGPQHVAADCLRVSGLTALMEPVCCKKKKCVSSNIEDALAGCCAKEEEEDDVKTEGLSKANKQDGGCSGGIAEELQLRKVLVQDVHVLQHVATGRETTQRVIANTQPVEFSSFFEAVGKTEPICLVRHLLRVVLLQVAAAADAASSHYLCGHCCCCCRCCDPKLLLMGIIRK